MRGWQAFLLTESSTAGPSSGCSRGSQIHSVNAVCESYPTSASTGEKDLKNTLTCEDVDGTINPRSNEFDRSIISKTGHRPWPMPSAPWLMTQSWHNLLFAHWRVDASELRKVVPAAFELDLFNEQAWVGIVPFYMTNVGLRATPLLPRLSSFPELNVRTYVHLADRPGVYFFSLDAGRRLAVLAARTLLNLPYFLATMSIETGRDGVVYHSTRRGQGAAVFRAKYGPTGPPFTASEGSLEYFLTERYCLYHRTRRGVPYRLEIHHPAWSLQVARAEIQANTMAVGVASGVGIGDTPALLHFARRQDVITWAPAYLRGDHRSVRDVTE
jgi:uncharacterized protein